MKLGKRINQYLAEVKDYAATYEQLKELIRALPAGPEKEVLEAQFAPLKAMWEVQKPAPVDPRAHWTRSDWIKEAEHQKAMMRTWKAGGKPKQTRRCELAAAKAEARAACLKAGS